MEEWNGVEWNGMEVRRILASNALSVSVAVVHRGFRVGAGGQPNSGPRSGEHWISMRASSCGAAAGPHGIRMQVTVRCYRCLTGSPMGGSAVALMSAA